MIVKKGKTGSDGPPAFPSISKRRARRIDELKDTYFHLQTQKKKIIETLEALEKAVAHLRKEAETLGVNLPAENEAKTPAKNEPLPQREEAGPPAQPGKKKVLVVDDDPLTLRLISYFLEKEGLAVELAESGTEGLKKAMEEKPDLLILDVMMPGINGFQMVEKLQSYPEMARLPVIFLSSLAEEENVLRGLKAGLDYIIKPFSPAILVAKIEKLLTIRNDSISQFSSR